MAWQIEMVTILRHLINDINGDTYSQARLEEAILVNAQLINKTIDFDYEYTIDVDAVTLTPDPTENTKDINFINLVCLKTALMIMWGELRTLSSQAVVVRDGPSSIDMSGAYKASKDLYNELLEQFQMEKINHQTGKIGRAILSPTTVEGLYTNGPFT
jgi:uncharacterized protein YjbI with pentapeptide repeats